MLVFFGRALGFCCIFEIMFVFCVFPFWSCCCFMLLHWCCWRCWPALLLVLLVLMVAGAGCLCWCMCWSLCWCWCMCWWCCLLCWFWFSWLLVLLALLVLLVVLLLLAYLCCTLLIYALPLGSGINHPMFWIECPPLRNVPVTFRMFLELCWFTLCHWEMTLTILLFASNVPLCKMYRSLFIFFWTLLVYAVPWGSVFACYGFLWVPLTFAWVALT